MAITDSLRGLSNLPLVRQMVLMCGLAASVAVGVSVFLWLQEPNYRALVSNMGIDTSSQVVMLLQQSGIPYKLDADSGTVLVPGKNYNEARLKLASAGLPKAAEPDVSWLNENSGFGSSRFMEDARYKHVVEGEIARTISSINGVQSARVHLAIPKVSAFVTDSAKPTASVFIKLQPGFHLEEDQVAAIVQLVAASISGLSPNDISVTDQNGNLLTSGIDSAMGKSKDEFNYQQKLQNEYAQRIVAILTPMLGPNKVHARIAADMDFTQQEITTEKFNPKDQVLKSEQTTQEQKSSGGAQGPVSVSDDDGSGASAAASPSGAGNSSRNQSVKSYEVGKSITYEKVPAGRIKYLTVAVVVDDHTVVDPKSGQVTRTKLTDDEMKKITDLAKNAVGFDEKRGDKISVINSPFATPEVIEELPPLPIWQQPWVLDIAKKTGGAFFALLAALIIIRPVLVNLAKRGDKAGNEGGAGNVATLGNIGDMPEIATPEMLRLKQQQIESLKNMVNQDPTKVAQVLKNWVGDK